jgi:hypothetical protein
MLMLAAYRLISLSTLAEITALFNRSYLDVWPSPADLAMVRGMTFNATVDDISMQMDGSHADNSVGTFIAARVYVTLRGSCGPQQVIAESITMLCIAPNVRAMEKRRTCDSAMRLEV